jgi:hypothetical protein
MRVDMPDCVVIDASPELTAAVEESSEGDGVMTKPVLVNSVDVGLSAATVVCGV